MNFNAYTGAPVDLSCDLLALPVFQDSFKDYAAFQAIDGKLDGLLTRLASEERFAGKSQQALSVHSHGRIAGQRIVLFGLGAEADFDRGELRHIAARAARAARVAGAKSFAVVLPPSHDDLQALQFALEGVLLGGYRYDRYRTSEDSQIPTTVETAIIATTTGADDFARLAARAETIVTAVSRARDLVNEPASDATPRRLATEAQHLADEHGLEVRVFGPDECREMGMGMFLAVAQGSDEEPRFIHLTYRPEGTPTKRVCLIGKGVTFDSGGLSLKPSQGMEDMKTDMAGAASVIAAIAAIAQLRSTVEVHAIAACTENMPSGKAYKLGDVLKSMNGKTVEINNTDAEGRLTLGDAITYAQKLEPDEIFDFATLTGACVVALGPNIAGVMSNTPALSERWLAAAKVAGEDMWPLPLPDRLRDQLKSEIADMKNTGERWGGALTAGIFLKEFAGTTPWVHVDIAGPSASDKEFGAIAKGGTGFAVATMIAYLTT